MPTDNDHDNHDTTDDLADDSPFHPWLDDVDDHYDRQPLDDRQPAQALDTSSSSFLEDDDEPLYYRSPPFREAELPSVSLHGLTASVAPLPVPPPRRRGYEDDGEEAGHTRSPTLPSPRSSSHSRSPSSSAPSQASNTLESLSRTISSLKSYVPSNTLKSYVPALKTYAAPSPPSVSRPVSFATFSAGEREAGGSKRRDMHYELRGDEFHGHEYEDLQRGHRSREYDQADEQRYWDLSWDQRPQDQEARPQLQPTQNKAHPKHSRLQQEFERDYELEQDYHGYGYSGDFEAGRGESLGQDESLIKWLDGESGPSRGEQYEDEPSRMEEDGLSQIGDDDQSQMGEEEPSQMGEQIAPPSWGQLSRGEHPEGDPSFQLDDEGRLDSERDEERHQDVVVLERRDSRQSKRQQTTIAERHRTTTHSQQATSSERQPTGRNRQQIAVPERQATLMPERYASAIPNRQQETVVPERQAASLNRQQTVVPERQQSWDDTSILDFARHGSGLAQAMRGTDRGGADVTARGRPGPVDLSEDGRPGIVDVGPQVSKEGRKMTGGGGTKHGYAHPAREADAICWARWDILGDKHLLILSYIPSGLQIWDCTDLGTVTEVLNLTFASADWAEFDVGRVIYAALLPSPAKSDSFKEDRPFLGMILESAQDPESTVFVVYSLSRHHVVVRVPVPGPNVRVEIFLSNEDFIVVSTTTPLPSLHILSSSTFSLLTTISYGSLAPYTTPSSSHSFSSSHLTPTTAQHNYISNNPILLGSRRGVSTTPIDTPNTYPHAVFALSKRLLAYACSPPSSSTTSKDHRRLSSTSTSTSVSAGSSSAASSWKSMTQGELALKVGGSMLSGMKFLGGMAYDAAVKRTSAGAGEPAPTAINKLFSRSAPTAGEEDEEEAKRRRRYSGEPAATAASHVYDRERTAGGGGYHVRVVDLASLLSSATMGTPRVVAEFQSSRSQPVADLRFSKDGCSLAVIPRDGHLIKVFQLRPAPAIMLGDGKAGSARTPSPPDSTTPQAQAQNGSVWQLYDLRRGRTSAVVDGVDWAEDGRWLAIGTRNRTVHIFPVNPYGGKVDVKSHLEGRVRNALAGSIIPVKTEVTPLVRLRGVKSQQVSPSSASEHHQPSIAPLAFIFLNPSDVTIPQNLLPSSPPVVDPTSSPPLSPRRAQDRPRNYQDILLFDSADGMLSLRRFTVEQHLKEPSLPTTVVQASVSAATSMSFPGMGGAGRLSASPSSAGASGSSRPSALTKMMDTPEVELSAKEKVVATWNLQRRRDWGEIKRPLVDSHRLRDWEGLGQNLDWLSQAEITTFSKSQRVLPRSLYLSHQFSFHTLGEDYHALIRRYQFDISGHKIEVRKEVEVNAFSSTTKGGAGESFVESNFSSAPRDIGRVSASFDEPLASALAAGFNHSPQSNQPIIPMFPNGTPGSKPKSFRSSIPIRTMAGLGDGMSEGFGRIRREIQHKVKSPLLVPSSDSSVSGHVPLEFDEEDEDFLGGGVGALLDAPAPLLKQASSSRGTSRDDGVSTDSRSLSGRSLSTSSTSVNLDDDVVGTVDEDIWHGWDIQDKLAVEEAERFDDISAAGYLDTEQEAAKPIATDGERKRKGRERRKR